MDIKNFIQYVDNNPTRIHGGIVAVGRSFATNLNKKLLSYRKNTNTVDPIEYDWDTLVILDACRYDSFEKVNWIDGDLSKSISPGTATPEFIDNCFENKQLLDTIYVGANPYMKLLSPTQFYKLIPLSDKQWDSTLGVVSPVDLTDRAIKIHNKYPNKRIIVHYMQPHFPFLTTDCELTDLDLINTGGMYHPQTTSDESLREAYEQTLSLALSEVDRLLDSIRGKIVITSDHGELLGERQFPIPVKGYDHHCGLYLPQLTEVPKLTLSLGSRRSVVSEQPRKKSDDEIEIREDRLKDLGYL